MKQVLFYIILLEIFGVACNRKACKDAAAHTDQNKSVPELPRFQQKLLDADTLASNTDTLLYFQRSACFGFCPAYTYTIYQNGMIKYNGQHYIEPLGTRYSLITEEWWKEVSEQIKKSDFFELASRYPLDEKMYIPDLPNIVIIIKQFGIRKSINDNHDAPKALKDFELFLEEKFKEINFKKD